LLTCYIKISPKNLTIFTFINISKYVPFQIHFAFFHYIILKVKKQLLSKNNYFFFVVGSREVMRNLTSLIEKTIWGAKKQFDSNLKTFFCCKTEKINTLETICMYISLAFYCAAIWVRYIFILFFAVFLNIKTLGSLYFILCVFQLHFKTEFEWKFCLWKSTFYGAHMVQL
jgi:hypothetical protein